jgi:hypothetical protein
MKYFTKLANKPLPKTSGTFIKVAGKYFIDGKRIWGTVSKGNLRPYGVPHHVSRKLSKKIEHGKKLQKMFKGKIQENIKNKKKYFDTGIKELRKQEEAWKNF